MSDLALNATSMRDRRGSPDRFGYEWDNYTALLPVYEEQFRRWTPGIAQAEWQGKTFLDVGCGMGRNSYWPMVYGAQGGVAVDLDQRSLRAAARTLHGYPTVDLECISAYDLPYTDRFDIVFSIGVLHHLEFPEQALSRMVKAAKPGGKVAIWTYGAENNRWLTAGLNPLRKAMFSRLPIGLVHHLSLYPAAMLWLALRIGIRPLAYFRLIAQFNFAHLRSIVFDQMLPQIAHYWTGSEVAALMQNAGLQDVRLDWVNEMSWAAIGTKPAARGQGD